MTEAGDAWSTLVFAAKSFSWHLEKFEQFQFDTPRGTVFVTIERQEKNVLDINQGQITE